VKERKKKKKIEYKGRKKWEKKKYTSMYDIKIK
jgi:hypothetical protein